MIKFYVHNTRILKGMKTFKFQIKFKIKIYFEKSLKNTYTFA